MAAASAVRQFLGRLTPSSCCPHHFLGGEHHHHHHHHHRHGCSSSQHGHPETDYAFEVIASTLRFGKGVTTELGHDVRKLKAKRTLVVTDRNVARTIGFQNAELSLKNLGIPFTVFDDVQVEPTDESVLKAIAFAKSGNFDCFVAVGGGSVIDTAKAAALYSANADADFRDFLCPPFGKNLTPEKPMPPLIAIPTTSGTGSETTGAAIFDLRKEKCKTGIRQRSIKPHLALVDPLNVKSMPRNVTVYSGFDVLCHALESFTALPYYERPGRPATPDLRPLYQGSNPMSDVWARTALQIIARHFRRSVLDEDFESRSQMLMAASLAGMGFGNAGVHLAHGLSYPISSQGKKYADPNYQGKLIPHGLSVVVTAPAVFRLTAHSNVARHAEAARLLGAEIDARLENDAKYVGESLATELMRFMSDFGTPNGLGELGFASSDTDSLTTAATNSVVNIAISPRKADRETIEQLYKESERVY